MMKNLGWWLVGIAGVLVLVYLLFRRDENPFLGTTRSSGDSFFSGVFGLLRGLGNTIGNSSTTTVDGFRGGGYDGATSTGSSFTVDYGGGDLSPEEEAAARGLAAEL